MEEVFPGHAFFLLARVDQQPPKTFIPRKKGIVDVILVFNNMPGNIPKTIIK